MINLMWPITQLMSGHQTSAVSVMQPRQCVGDCANRAGAFDPELLHLHLPSTAWGTTKAFTEETTTLADALHEMQIDEICKVNYSNVGMRDA